MNMNMNPINDQALETVAGACGNLVGDRPLYEVNDYVTCFRGIRWIVRKVVGTVGDFSYLCEAQKVPTDWRDLIKVGATKYLPEDQLSFGW